MTARRKKTPAPPVGDVNAHVRARKALQLLIMGYTYERIAEMCGWGSRASAYKACARELQRYMAPVVEEARAVEVARLDAMLQVWMPRALGSRADRSAAEVVLKVAERRGRLMGLDFAARETPAVNGHPNTYIVGIPDGHPTDAPLPAMAMPDGIPQPGPGDVVLAIPQSVVDAI